MMGDISQRQFTQIMFLFMGALTMIMFGVSFVDILDFVSGKNMVFFGMLIPDMLVPVMLGLDAFFCYLGTRYTLIYYRQKKMLSDWRKR